MNRPVLAVLALTLLHSTVGGSAAAQKPLAPKQGAAGAKTAAEPVAADTDFSACEARYAVTGLPRMKSDGAEQGRFALCHPGYAVAFNPLRRTPDWVIERLPDAFLHGKAKRQDKFIADPAVGAASATNSDYRGSDYDRGHQAPAGDFKSSQPMTDDSFLFTNMAPQVGIGFNRNIWKQLETDVRSWVLCGGRSELYVVTGPIYKDNKPAWIGPHGQKDVAVPDAFFKVIYDPVNKRALGMMLPNQKLDTKDLPKYAVAISDIEEKTGITFFPAMTKRQQTVLKSSAGTLWGADDSCSADTSD